MLKLQKELEMELINFELIALKAKESICEASQTRSGWILEAGRYR